MKARAVGLFLRDQLPAALIAGLLLGVGARATMRLIAWTSGIRGAASWGGSLEVVLFGTLVGGPVALLFLAVRGRLPLVRPPWAGVVFGSLIFLVLALAPPPAAASALAQTADPPAITALLFWLLLALFGGGLDCYGQSRSPSGARPYNGAQVPQD
jgi:hypothetical protein